MIHRLQPPALAAALLLLAGLASSPPPPLRAQLAPTEASQAAARAYIITNTDRLRVAVYQEDELSVIARVDAQGNINLPLVGAVKVSRLNIVQAEQAVEAAFRDGRYLRFPKVTINVEEYAPREVSIQGQIRSPGRYPLPIEAGMTILELVTRAGGLTDTARGTVTVTRILPDGTKKVFSVDVDSLIKGRRNASVSDNSLILESGDIVFVPERLI
ncbi:hypothetical protein Ga0100231_002460 [Opitutaceae bacterium TAV4]|uniref:polysaccharide biosynthesis/export family protein n=1 Tax=Geminisphaera colitermitum TaxID=1148786 RepID=UPI0001964F08|nr:polysaccharide biosynthesis/export family protein [Geminisphaera colitermitum]RRJ97424.1 hypothetical protein Ga0100231_002460 [Opitutaceae bacterium TAV4]RRK01804.1 hypothetical protein Ga0100230_000595 [Opitutaceae bacterium TAV3]